MGIRDYFNFILWHDALLNLDPNDIFVKRIYKTNNSLDGFPLILLKSFIGRRKARRIRKRRNRYRDYLVCSVYFVSKIITRAIITGALSIINGNLSESLAICFRIMILSLESVISDKLSIFLRHISHWSMLLHL